MGLVGEMYVGLSIFYSKEKDWVWHKARHYPLLSISFSKMCGIILCRVNRLLPSNVNRLCEYKG